MTEPTQRVVQMKSHNFHEFAGALGITTDQILAVRRERRKNFEYTVLYNEIDTQLFLAIGLMHDEDNILRAVSEPIPIPGLWESLSEAGSDA